MERASFMSFRMHVQHFYHEIEAIIEGLRLISQRIVSSFFVGLNDKTLIPRVCAARCDRV